MSGRGIDWRWWRHLLGLAAVLVAAAPFFVVAAGAFGAAWWICVRTFFEIAAAFQ